MEITQYDLFGNKVETNIKKKYIEKIKTKKEKKFKLPKNYNNIDDYSDWYLNELKIWIENFKEKSLTCKKRL